MEFVEFKKAVAARFTTMAKGNLFRVNVSGETLWDTYLASFPEGSNPIFRERTEHDCSCCRSFIKQVGNIVAIRDGRLVSLWDSLDLGHPYGPVAEKMAELIVNASIEAPFLHSQSTAGTDKNFEQMVDRTQTWNHFFINIPSAFVKKGVDIPSVIGEYRGSHDVFLRSLNEITDDAVDSVLEIIKQGALYRGQEHEHSVAALREALTKVKDYTADQKDRFVWDSVMGGTQASVRRIRNTSIGTLLVDLSAGMDLDSAVKKFEVMVAPSNYKRPTALVTPKMIEQAKEKVQELGLLSALERRHATVADVGVNNVLFVNRATAKVMQGDDPFAALKGVAKVAPKDFSKIDAIPLAKFLSDVVSGAKSIEVLMTNKLLPNLASLTAPTDPTARRLFKWASPIAWSYNGGVADSELRRAVAARGGRVDGVFRFSHSWNYDKRNASLMDLHVFMPGSTMHDKNVVDDAYGTGRRVGWNHRGDSQSDGRQDVDFTPAAPEGYVPVENITFPDLARMPEGEYICKIHNWTLRSPTKGGFRAEIEFDGNLYQYEVDRPLAHKEWVTVAVVTLKNGAFTIDHRLPTAESTKSVWGINTNDFHPVRAILKSPNHWDGECVGNEHLFFIIDGCLNDQPIRGFYNEFLDSRLDPHRKVFELLGSKMLIAPAPDQLSGLGFSSTQRNMATVKVTGSTSRIFNVRF